MRISSAESYALLRDATIFVAITVACSLQAAAAEPSPGKDTDWLRDARCGVFMHFLPGDDKGLALVEKFDVDVLARQLESAGAKYLVITLGQNSGYFNSPNATYDKTTGYAPGQRCSKRDLPLALHQALKPKGIRLMLYLPCQTPANDAGAQKAFGLAPRAGDRPIDEQFASKWAAVIREWSDRYDDKLSGWWFDGGYAWLGFNEAIAQTYARAAKHGNPHAIVTFNPGIGLRRHTQAEDYTAGELNKPLGTIPASRWVQGSQWHALTILGSDWGQKNTRFPADRWADWMKKVAAHEGAVTLDAGANWDPAAGPIGSLAEEQVRQLQAVRAALESDRKEQRGGTKGR